MGFVRVFALCVIAAFASSPAFSQSFPNKPVHLVVAYAPGGATDITARVIGRALATMWGQSVIVENRPGASGMVGAEMVVRSIPDGYTLLVGYAPEVGLNKLLFARMSYDPERDLLPITLLTASPLVLAVHPSIGAKTIGELVALAKSKPGTVNCATPGLGGQQHLACESLGMIAGVGFTSVPYKGTGPAMVDLLGGQVQMMFASIAPLLPHLRAGKLVPIAIADDKRSPLLPEVPTFAEAGFDRFEFVNWFGLLAPAGTPSAVIDKLNHDVAAALRQEDVKQVLEAQGLDTRPGTPKEFSDFVRAEMSKYGRIVREANIKAE